MQGRCAHQRGYGLIELVIALGLFVTVTFALLTLFRGVASGGDAATARDRAYRDMTELLRTWDREADSAIALFIPASDVLGNPNADGHEVDFYAKDVDRNPRFWAWRYDATAHTVRRYTYATPGTAATAVGAVLSGVTLFTAQKILASALVSDATAGSALHGYTPKDVVVQTGWAGVTAGNALTEIRIANAEVDRTIRLLPGATPTGFTVKASYTPAPGATDGAGHLVVLESDCAKADGFDTTDVTTTPPTDYWNQRPGGCAGAAPVAHERRATVACGTAADAYVSTDNRPTPPVDLYNVPAATLAAACGGTTTATPPAFQLHLVTFTTDCTRAPGVISVDGTTTPPTDTWNLANGCSNPTPPPQVIYDWQYVSTTTGCPWDAPVDGTGRTCTLVATLIRSDDHGLGWTLQDCAFDGSFSTNDAVHTYVADATRQGGCPVDDVLLMPPLYRNAADPRSGP